MSHCVVEFMGHKTNDFLVMPFPASGSGIYAIMNRDNGKIYVGSAVSIGNRIRVHKYQLCRGSHHSRYLQRAFNKSPESFYVEVVEEIPNPTRALLVDREQFWLDFYRSSDKSFGYNLSPTAHSCLGYKHTSETVANMSRSRIGRRHTQEARARMSVAQKIAKSKVKPHTETQTMIWSLARMGHSCSDAEKQRKREWHETHTTTRYRPVLQFTLDGICVKEFRSVADAARSVGCKKSGNIGQVCRNDGSRRMANGFMWRYASDVSPNEVLKLRPKIFTKRKRVKIWVNLICNYCGKDYERQPSEHLESRYCCAKCRNQAGTEKAAHMAKQKRMDKACLVH